VHHFARYKVTACYEISVAIQPDRPSVPRRLLPTKRGVWAERDHRLFLQKGLRAGKAVREFAPEDYYHLFVNGTLRENVFAFQ